MKVFKRVMSVAVATAMLLGTVGCDDVSTVEGFTYQWTNSNIFETIDETADADPKDDFAAYVNHEWSTKQERDFSYTIGPFGDVSRKVDANKRALINDESVQNKNIELVRIADGLYDVDYRNSLGVEPLKKYLKCIDDINSLADVSAYMIDNDSNPFALSLVELDYVNDEGIDDAFTLMVETPEPTLEKTEYYLDMTEDAFKKKQTKESQVEYLLDRCGYTKDDIDKTISQGFRFESELIHLAFNETWDYVGVHTRDEMIEKAGAYPLGEMLDHYSITDSKNYSGALVYLDELETIYTENNVEDIKSYFKLRLCEKAIRYLDSDSFDVLRNTAMDKTNPFEERHDKDPEWYFYEILKESFLGGAMDQAYIDYYYDRDVCDDMLNIIHMLKEKYKIEINENETLSDEGKKAVAEKLDKINEFVMKPSNTADYSGIELVSSEEGGSYLDALCVLNKFKYEHIGDMTEIAEGKVVWDIYNSDTSTTNVNSYYYPPMNSIFIDIGILEEPAYSIDDPFEKKLAFIGTILGHELSHAFDSHGIHYDANGNLVDFISADDLKNWNVMSGRIRSQLSSFETFDGSGYYEASNDITGEAIADIEGGRVCLLLAKDYDDFDYDTFFREYAVHWQRLESKRDVMDRIKTDPHPLAYLRINYVLMQYEEFYEEYDIGPSDGMYIAPEYRIKIW